MYDGTGKNCSAGTSAFFFFPAQPNNKNKHSVQLIKRLIAANLGIVL
jgi:hypothetical protein